MGIVVPLDQSGVGYRDLQMSNGRKSDFACISSRHLILQVQEPKLRLLIQARFLKKCFQAYKHANRKFPLYFTLLNKLVFYSKKNVYRAGK